MTMWNDYEKIARRLDRIAKAFERIANALETANIIEADRKTENSSEIPNNCEELNAYRECVKSRSFWDSKHCDGCFFEERCPFEPQTEYRRVGQAIDSVTGKVLGETYDVPQTDCSWK